MDMSEIILSATLNAPNIARCASSPFGAVSSTFEHQYIAFVGFLAVSNPFQNRQATYSLVESSAFCAPRSSHFVDISSSRGNPFEPSA